jgi:lysyl-tRNA synthetase class 2
MPSTVIRHFAYDRASAALDVMFHNGRNYRYFLVPPRVADELGEAFSKGHYFNARIRDRYPFEELAAEEPAPPLPAASPRKVTSPRKGSPRRP